MTTDPTDSAGSPAPAPAPAPWYADGLRFECQWPECRACCTGSPGFVWITMEEAEELAGVLNEPLHVFLSTRCKQVDNRMSLIEVGEQNDCTLLAPGGCSVYEHRPAQCRSYPFWPEVVRSEQAWNDEAKWCPGINHGRVWTQDEIDEKRRSKDGSRPFWHDQRVIDDVRNELLAAVRENFEKQAEASALADDELPWTDPEDDPEDDD